MSKRRGLSRDEKKETIIGIFRETKEPYAIQDMEKVASKKGVVLQTVKDVVLELVDDGDVMADKIGVTTFYWSFPSEAVNKRKRDIDNYTTEIDGLKRRRVELEEEHVKLLVGREPSEERTQRICELKLLKDDLASMTEELQVLAENDPAIIDALQEDIKTATDAANRWTDNIFSMRSWAADKFNVDKAEFDRNFSIPMDFDYYEPK